MTEEAYYDNDGIEIQEGDLLQVYHFRHYLRKRKMYMYHVAVLSEDGYWRAREYDAKVPHYLLKSVANKETRIIRGTKIIFKKDWQNEDTLRKQGRERIKNSNPTQ